GGALGLAPLPAPLQDVAPYRDCVVAWPRGSMSPAGNGFTAERYAYAMHFIPLLRRKHPGLKVIPPGYHNTPDDYDIDEWLEEMRTRPLGTVGNYGLKKRRRREDERP